MSGSYLKMLRNIPGDVPDFSRVVRNIPGDIRKLSRDITEYLKGCPGLLSRYSEYLNETTEPSEMIDLMWGDKKNLP